LLLWSQWLTNNSQAPSVHLVGSTYYMYYSVSVFGSQASAIGYATSPTMEVGSWTDHGATGIASSSGKPYNAIDGALIQATDGSYYVTFGSFWSDSKSYFSSSPFSCSKQEVC
jgi:arabinan endo-1,5-alpha-L-arabinosidase